GREPVVKERPQRHQARACDAALVASQASLEIFVACRRHRTPSVAARRRAARRRATGGGASYDTCRPQRGRLGRSMTNRRELLKAGLATTALPLVGTSALAATPAPSDFIALYKVVYDTRFGASVAFAHRAAASGVAIHGMSGDVTRFWYDDLYHRWRESPAAIAGLTAQGALFCLEQLAWDHRMRVVFRAEHSCLDGGVAHALEGPQEILPAAVAAVAEPRWAAAMADVVVGCPRGRAERGAARARTRAPATAAP